MRTPEGTAARLASNRSDLRSLRVDGGSQLHVCDFRQTLEGKPGHSDEVGEIRDQPEVGIEAPAHIPVVADHRKAAVPQTFYDPDFPQRTIAVQLLRPLRDVSSRV